MPRLRGLATGLFFLTSGCTTYRLEEAKVPPLDARAPVPAGLAEICVMHPKPLSGLPETHIVTDNGEIVGGVRYPGYFCYFARPGFHHVTSDSTDHLALEVTPGAQIFLAQYDTQYDSGGENRLTQIPL